MTNQDIIRRWKQNADKNFKTAQDLIKLKHYDWALFIGQLALEKLLKGLIIKETNGTPPFIHNLNKLANLAGIELDNNTADDFTEISRFNIQARYDDIKYEFYKTATKQYATKWFNKITQYYTWLKKNY